MKLVVLAPVPAEVVTWITPVVAPTGSVAVILVLETTVKSVATTPLKSTDVAPVKPNPVRVTIAPTAPLVGLKEVIFGAVTVKLVRLAPVPPGVVTWIKPVVAPAGTVSVIFVQEVTVKVVTATPLTSTALAPVKPDPDSVTTVPHGPLVGENELIFGKSKTVKIVEVHPLPAIVVAQIFPGLEPIGTLVEICVSELIVNVALLPLKVTFVTKVKPVPVRVTGVPMSPLAGENAVIFGFGTTMKLEALQPVPNGEVTQILPVVADEGTFAVNLMSEMTTIFDKLTATPLKVTLVVPVNFEPLTVTVVPLFPRAGLNELTEVPSKKSVALKVVPAALVTPILPVVAPAGKVAVICVADSTVNVAAVPLNETPVTALKSAPVMTTAAPEPPLVGVNEVIVGSGGSRMEISL